MAAAGAAPGRERNVAVLYALGSMSTIQFAQALSKPLFAHLTPPGAVTLRLVLAGGVLALTQRPRFAGRPARELAAPIALGACTGLFTLSFAEAINRIPLGIAAAIEFVGPLGVALAGSRQWRDAIWVGLAAIGIALLTLGHPVGGSLDAVGLVLAFLSAAGWATYIVLTKRVGQQWSGMSGLAVSLPVAALTSLPFSLVHAGHRFAHPGWDLLGLGLGFLLPLGPFMLELAALRRLPTRVFGVLMSLEPGMGALFGLIILGQSLALGGVVAVVLIVLASVGVTLTSAPGPAVATTID